MSTTLYNEKSLQKQIDLQRHTAWDLESAIPWTQGVDLNKPLLPLDRDALVFPGVRGANRLALSQALGLIVNATISEMEGVIDAMRDDGWEQWLRRYPVNPEMRELGELFFEEERKHSTVFKRYNQLFCEQMELKPRHMERLLPKAYGSRFLAALQANARQGGFAFWWVVAAVEEVSILIYQMMHPHEHALDPLCFCVHRKHLEDEARHRNYAFLMLELAHQSRASWGERCVRKLDLVLAQTMTAGWVLAELHRIYGVRELQNEHPFFKRLSHCLERGKALGVGQVIYRLFVTAPYTSFVLNTHHQRQTLRYARRFKVWSVPWPKPRMGKLHAR